MTICRDCKHCIKRYRESEYDKCRVHRNKYTGYDQDCFRYCENINKGNCKDFEKKDPSFFQKVLDIWKDLW